MSKRITRRVFTVKEVLNKISRIAKGRKNCHCSFSRMFFHDKDGFEYKIIVERTR